VERQVKICTQCVLPETFPGIKFDENGVCNFCRDFRDLRDPKEKKSEYRRKFEGLIEEQRGRSSYDALMAFSGGKDSTYTLAVLKEEYGLNILALTFDNGFLPAQTVANISQVVERLKVDHLIFKPRFDVLAKIFSHCAARDVYPGKALERTSAVCNSCMGILKYFVLRLAIEKEIPFIAYGWSPGQAPITSSILRNIPQMVKQMQNTFLTPLRQIVGNAIDPYFLQEKHFGGNYKFPINVHPLAFMDYDVEAVEQSIKRFGWKRPENVDANSTNCLLNSLGNLVHKQRLGFHPYAFELANLVRMGHLDRAAALQRLNQPEPEATVAQVRVKLASGEKLLD
jgi:tRNA(Ile)-lysidine synthase TilS/MesJ